MAKTKFCKGVSDLSDSYTGFILDGWGVIHDGKAIYPEVHEVLDQLKARKKEVIILTNSSRSEETNIEQLEKMGLQRNMYTHMVSSGEFIRQGLKDRKESIFAGLGERVFLLNRKGDTSLIDGLGLKKAHDPENADFMLITGSDAPEKSLEDYDPVLRKASQKRIKAICANPDMFMMADGKTYFGAGQIAKRYASFGGVVDFIGKPYQPIIRHCMSMFKEALPASTVIIGDSMAHDIMAGALLNVDTALVASGVHAKNFDGVYDDPAEKDKVLNALVNNYGCKPNYLLNQFNWGLALPDRKHKKPRKK
ncbi:MAG: TIGR01459 family HAD-type hydrolase [Micavibrio sp.]|nr:TIGR01459 family HAD-type hydrolase [Micavibrio sp.]|tara:strand:+ start:1092 stop:2015 length:924 start_codon:yes stop_codon:yes gene_type:complete